MEFFLTISLIFNAVFIYVIINLYRKVSALEDLQIENRDKFITVNNMIVDTIEEMRRIDRSGVFEADDEVGNAFEGLLDTVNELEGVIYVEEEEKE